MAGIAPRGKQTRLRLILRAAPRTLSVKGKTPENFWGGSGDKFYSTQLPPLETPPIVLLFNPKRLMGLKGVGGCLREPKLDLT